MMWTWTERWRGRMVVVAVATTVTGACSDVAGPDPEPSSVVSLAGSRAATSPFHPNSVRYRDTGARPATGRAGGAELSAWALLDSRGVAELTVIADTASMLNPLPDAGPGQLGSVQVKGFDAGGKLMYTRVDPQRRSHTARYELPGLGPDSRIQVQATVSEAGTPRTGVVTLDAPVLRRPSLRFGAATIPIRAAARTAINLAAAVQETNGDVGAQATCVLYVNGAEVDRAWGIWIDAGDAATCVFTHFFAEVGSYDVEIRVEDIQPRAYDDERAIDPVSGTISIIPIHSSFWYAAQFEDLTFEEESRSRGSWRTANGVEGQEWENEYSNRGRTQMGWVSAWIPRPLSFPLDQLAVSQRTRDEIAHAAAFGDLEPSWTFEDEHFSQSCVTRDFLDVNGRAWMHLCTFRDASGFGSTDVTYERYAGNVTYHSRNYTRYWNRDLGIDDVWSWNDEGVDEVGRFVSYGSEYGFTIRIADDGEVFSMNPLIWMHTEETQTEWPWECWTWSDDWASQEWCSESRYNLRAVRGTVIGEPTW